MLAKVILAVSIASALGALAIVYLTTPATIHPIGLLVFFVCVYGVVLGLVTGMLYVSHHIYQRLTTKNHSTTLAGIYEYATVIALGPVILLALQTVGRLQFIDVVFTAIFVVLGCFYIARRRG